jgi:serine/threonine protein kinase
MTAESDFPIPAGLVNGRYQLQSLIGHTNLGIDFLAHDVLLDRDVVFKALSTDLTADRSFVERFRAQAQTTANLTHPGLAAVLDWGRDPNGIEGIGTPAYYLVSEHCPGRTLRELVDLNGPLPMNRALHVLVGVTSALSYAHRADVLHGGLSPDNVIISPTGVVKVSDLGLSLALGPSWQPPTDRPDMALWRSPEQFRSDPIDTRTDVYQIGLLAYFLTTGRVPFPGDSVAQIAQRQLEVIPPAPSKLNAKIPKPLEGIIGRSLAKKSAERFASVTEQRAALVRFRESRTSTAASPDVTTALPASSSSAPIAAGLAATGALATGALATGGLAAGAISTGVGTDQTGNDSAATTGSGKLVVDRSSSDDATSMLAAPDATRIQTKSPASSVDDDTADHATDHATTTSVSSRPAPSPIPKTSRVRSPRRKATSPNSIRQKNVRVRWPLSFWYCWPSSACCCGFSDNNLVCSARPNLRSSSPTSPARLPHRPSRRFPRPGSSPKPLLNPTRLYPTTS